MNYRSIFSLCAALGTVSSSACIPLTVGSTAKPVPVGTTVRSMSMYAVPNSFSDETTDDRDLPRFGMDPEVRFGIDESSDIGVRAPSFSGIVANYKHRLNGPSSAPGAPVSLMVGGGLVNWGDHLHLEATLMTSAEEKGTFTPYTGLRAMQVVPLNRGAVHDSPTIGAFFGARLGTSAAGISPEIGVFYDHSALGIRRGNVLFVPAITVHGDFARFLLPW